MCKFTVLIGCSDFETLDETEAELNNQLALDMAEQELGISPIMTGQEMSELDESDSLCMVMYLSQVHDLFKDTIPPSGKGNILLLLMITVVVVLTVHCSIF